MQGLGETGRPWRHARSSHDTGNERPESDVRTAARLAALGIWNVSVSIDGASPAMHDTIRGIPGLFFRRMSVSIWLKPASGVTVNP